MRNLISVAALMALAAPAFALPNPTPEPETLSLLAIGVLGLLLARRNK